MTGAALIVTYHAVEPGPAPLCIDPGLFKEHLDWLSASGARMMTVSELGTALERGDAPPGAVALTFDDGFASVVDEAAPLLVERGLVATVFCVSGHLGRRNDWATQPPGAPLRPLARARELRSLARAGFEIGSHGWDHAPLTGASESLARRELLDSKDALEHAIQAPVGSFAYPYGAAPSPAAEALVRRAYLAACTTSLGMARTGSDPFALPRVDCHYLRRPAMLRLAVSGSLGPYLEVRRLAARARRTVRKDYLETARR
jgi:peptidoglycan/xylan/chitin deacetylase (PgdA/CDA1 family)